MTTLRPHHTRETGAASSRLGLRRAVAAALAAAGLAGPAAAQQAGAAGAPRSQLSEAQAQRYRTADGALQFVIDRSGPAALIQLEGDPEVRILRPDPVIAVGGDQFYRTADGSIILRATRWGELTVFVRDDQMGAAATFAERAAPLRPRPAPPLLYRSRVQAAQETLVRRVGRAVAFEAPSGVESDAAGVLVDAAERAVEGLAAAPQLPIRRVVFRIGRIPAAAAEGDTLVVTVVPQLGYAGRPSSEMIRRAISDRR